MGTKLETLPLHIQKQVLKELAKQAPPPAPPKEPKRNKYGAKRTEVEGIWFDSEGEAGRWIQLRRERAMGRIRNLERQIAYQLKVGDYLLGVYKADFVYEEFNASTAEWVKVVEDFKGKRTDLFNWKEKHLFAQYGIKIRISTREGIEK